VSADEAPERAVYRGAGEQTDLDFVEAHAEVAVRQDSIVTVDGEHGAARRRMTREPEHDGNRRTRECAAHAP
jgi:hypothetical protein